MIKYIKLTKQVGDLKVGKCYVVVDEFPDGGKVIITKAGEMCQVAKGYFEEVNLQMTYAKFYDDYRKTRWEIENIRGSAVVGILVTKDLYDLLNEEGRIDGLDDPSVTNGKTMFDGLEIVVAPIALSGYAYRLIQDGNKCGMPTIEASGSCCKQSMNKK